MQSASTASRAAFEQPTPVDDWHPGRSIPVYEIWTRLAAGQFKIKSAQHSLGRCFVSLARLPLGGSVASDLAWKVTERILCGDQSKVIASDFGLSCSTVSTYWHSTLAALCDPIALTKARAFFVVCACSTRALDLPSAIVHGVGEGREALVSVGLAQDRLRDMGLSRAEREVAEAIVLGKLSEEICEERNTSPRTVANQINAIYRKLGISGRRELVVAALVPRAGLVS